jgi:hypothetical protein
VNAIEQDHALRVLREALRRTVGHLGTKPTNDEEANRRALDDYHAARMLVGRTDDGWDDEAAGRGMESIRREALGAEEPVPAKTGEKMGLWRKNGVAGGKYLVTRRDGTVPEWPSFVLGAKDPAAEEALRAYAREAERRRFDPRFVADVKVLADEFMNYREERGEGDPDGAPHRKDDPATVSRMLAGANG